MISRAHRTSPHAATFALAAVLALALAGCGSTSPGSSQSAATGSQTQTATALAPAVNQLQAAEHPTLAEFPAARGRTLRQLGALAKSSAQLGAATGTFTPGVRRVAFGLTNNAGAFIYAPSAVYVAPSPSAPGQGPFLAPADPMSVAPQYRSRQNAGPGDIQAIYGTEVPVPKQGTYTILALTQGPSGLIGSPGEIAVAASSPIPDAGQRPPAIATDTLTSVHGDVSLLTTRIPPEQMHAVSFNKVLGKRPIALLFSTPQLCISKVCGPVTDIATQLEHEFSGRITFIHEEVYLDNQPSKGLRPQLKAFHLQTEPWLFTINRRGMITARLEGAFGVDAFTAALESALK